MARKPKIKKAVIREAGEVLWEDLPGHFDGALSKMLITPSNSTTKHFDFRLSTYQPKGFVAKHTHKTEEQIYYMLEGEGLMELDRSQQIVRAGTTIFIPSGVEHALYNTGIRDLTFLVITSPPLTLQSSTGIMS